MKSQINIQFQDGGLADSQVWGLTLREGISELYRADADLVIPESSLTLSSLKNDLLRKPLNSFTTAELSDVRCTAL